MNGDLCRREMLLEIEGIDRQKFQRVSVFPMASGKLRAVTRKYPAFSIHYE